MSRNPAMKTRLALALAFACLCAARGRAEPATDESGRETLRRAMARNLIGFDQARLVVALTVKASKTDAGEERRIVVRNWRHGGDLERSLCFTAPADLKDTAFLATSDGGQFLWLPELGRVRQVSRSSRSEPFLGTTFSFRDVEGWNLDDATTRRLDDATIDGQACAVIEATLKPSAGEEYGKLTAWVRKSDDLPLRVQLFDTAGHHVKTLFTRKVGTQPRTGVTYTQAARMEDLRSGGSTVLEIVASDFEAQLDAAAFTVAELRRGLPCAP
jgi:hypothetical protein